jgi:hypothetical protein
MRQPVRMSTQEIRKGSRVLARSALDTMLQRRAVSGVEAGIDFPVVRICTEDEWVAAEREGRDPAGIPWPADEVQPDPSANGAPTL